MTDFWSIVPLLGAARVAWAPALVLAAGAGAGAVAAESPQAGSPPAASPGAPVASQLAADRQWQMLVPPGADEDLRATLRHAADLLGDWSIELAGVSITAPSLRALADTPPEESLVRAARELYRRPIDVLDFVHFLDDALLAGSQGLRQAQLVVTAGRARRAGILIHPSEVFGSRSPRVYGESETAINLDRPFDPSTLPPAADHSPLAAEWAARYPNPTQEGHMLAELERVRPGSDFAARVRTLVEQLREQGTEVFVDSSVRPRERGYLMWGAFELSRAKSQQEVSKWARELDRLNRRWRLQVPIRWLHPDGWQATVEAARQMAEAYAVVYATRRGARYSDHYDGVAVDVTAVGLPRTLTLRAPDGQQASFDLSAPEEPRDLSLTPSVILWIEEHFGFRKLHLDYPHWSDARQEKNR